MVDSPMFQEPQNLPVSTGSTDSYETLSADQMHYVTDEAELLHRINQKLDKLIEKSDVHTAAVNQFGGMLDYVVKTVAGFGEAIQKQGLMGLMKSMTGGGNG